MTERDENELTDEELLEMWDEAQPVEVAQPTIAPPRAMPGNEHNAPPSRRTKRSTDHRGA
jgi:hypothetical protein